MTVTLDEDRALAQPDKGGHEEAYEILIPTEKYEQHGTDLPQGLWDRSLQVAFLFHELGHVYYSDFDRFGDCLKGVGGRWRDLFRMVYNTVEDGVIETQVANEFNVTGDFIVLNEVLANRADRRHRQYVELFDLETVDGEPVQSYTVFEALAVGLLDRGFVDSGRFDAIVDPGNERRVVHNGRRDALVDLIPVMDDYVTEMLSDPSGTKRVTRAREFFESARATFESLPPLQSNRLQTAPVRPADARARQDWGVKPADKLPDERAANERVTGDQRDERTTQSGTGQRAEVGSTDDHRPPGSLEDETVRRVARQRTRAQASRGTTGRSPLEQEARRLLGIVDDDTTDLEKVVVVDPVEEGDMERWTAAVDRSRKLQQDLATQLRRERRPRDTGGYRAGRLDGRRLVAANRGTQRVFTRRESGTMKDYSCLVVLDRSGSMDGDPIRTAETATAQLVHALFEVGVDVSVLSVWEGTPCLEVPFGARPADHVDRLMTERADWGTPLSTAVAVSRKRIDRGEGSYPFVVVVTDGEPDDPTRYRSELEKCTFPVFGVYIGADSGSHTEFFDHITYADADSLERTLQRLVRTLFSTEA
ncbi:vWA domain-containing protein [Halosimplex pelagicum]|uniref:vWA domain-containing protein n=1 Tax=Halosimplex pelagicum TaxID=869886 RepID=UPI001FE3D38F|nr:vWA domain-containing protein [Halosimplex pelagicum]